MKARAAFFRTALGLLEKHTPGIFRSLQIQILLNATAEGFSAPGTLVFCLPPEKALKKYAAFTAECMRREPAGSAHLYRAAHDTGYPAHSEILCKRLYRTARSLGSRIRTVTGFTEPEDLTRLVFYLYRNIRISMRGTLPGALSVSACYFSRLYSARECAVMSNMDSGIIAGIFGGGRLIFSERITEGCRRCRACFKQKGEVFP